LEIEAFIVAGQKNPGTYRAVQCSSPSGPMTPATDHIVVRNENDGQDCDYNALVGAGYDCSSFLGYIYEPGQGPGAGSLPGIVGQQCSLWRFAYNTSGGGAHLFTRGSDNTIGTTCEKSIGNVFSQHPVSRATP
jgi:hypothetical protein